MVQVSQPKRFRTGAILAIHAYNVLLIVPIFLALLAVSLMKLGIITVLLPAAAFVITAWFLPLGLGNPYVARVVRSMHSVSQSNPGEFVVQITVYPRLRSGVRALVEDADDFGLLTCTDSELVFRGDSLQLNIPYEQISQLHPHNVGVRGRFLYGRRIEMAITGVPGAQVIEMAERSSWFLPGSKRIARELF
ncbi:MAG TPA: hypothetical protein VLT36_26300, partial [Candidatus Dormibacteraeota bacterium]|nr:hypothetical protein [Candidatus Dormibacteraeota bacterium]